MAVSLAIMQVVDAVVDERLASFSIIGSSNVEGVGCLSNCLSKVSHSDDVTSELHNDGTIIRHCASIELSNWIPTKNYCSLLEFKKFYN